MLAYGIFLPVLDTTLVSRFGLLPRIKDLYLSRLSVIILAISFALLAFAPSFDFVFIGRFICFSRSGQGCQRPCLTRLRRNCGLYSGYRFSVVRTVPCQLPRRLRHDRYSIHRTGNHGHYGDPVGWPRECRYSQVEYETGRCWERNAVLAGLRPQLSHDDGTSSSTRSESSFREGTGG